jgi:hypothetical protein
MSWNWNVWSGFNGTAEKKLAQFSSCSKRWMWQRSEYDTLNLCGPRDSVRLSLVTLRVLSDTHHKVKWSAWQGSSESCYVTRPERYSPQSEVVCVTGFVSALLRYASWVILTTKWSGLRDRVRLSLVTLRVLRDTHHKVKWSAWQGSSESCYVTRPERYSPQSEMVCVAGFIWALLRYASWQILTTKWSVLRDRVRLSLVTLRVLRDTTKTAVVDVSRGKISPSYSCLLTCLFNS